MSTNKIGNHVSFTVDFIDELGQPWKGTFEECKAVLSANEESLLGRNRRSLLGAVSSDTSADAEDFYYAQAQCEIQVRCAKPECVPQWWAKAGGGDLPRSVIHTVFVAMGTAIKTYLEELRERAEKARGEVRQARDKQREQEKV